MEITAVRGLGEWSAQFFLMFHLERPDVCPRATSDPQGGADRLRPRRAAGPEELTEIAEPWRPHRTLACLYLWESLATRGLFRRVRRGGGYLSGCVSA